MIRKCLILAIASALLSSGCLRRSYTSSYSDRLSDHGEDAEFRMLSVEDTNAAFRESESAAESALRDLLVRRLESTEESSGYRIGVGDKLDMSVFDVPELSSSTIVNDAGFVELPVVGAVQVIGKTLSEAREAIRKALSGPVKRPDINLVISEFGSQRVAVLGAVSKPGAYPLRRHVSSFSELLGEAGGLSERAGNFVQLLPSEMTGVSSRNDPTDRTLAALKAIKAGTSSKGIEVPIALLLGSHGNMPLDVPLRGGDVVIVPEAGRVTVDGEVVSRGAVQIQPGMTMMGAVGAAGGVTYSADLEQFELIRADAAGGPKHLVVNAEKVMAGEEKDVLVRSGDIIRIPSLVGRRIRQDTFDHISQFFNFGLSGALPGN